MARALVSFEDDDKAGSALKGPPAWLFPVAVVAAVLQLALFAYVVATTTILKPYSDEYAFLSDAFEWRDGRLSFFAYLWHPHVGHHAVWVRLLTAWEAAQVGGSWPTVAAAVAALVIAAGLLGWAAWRDDRLKTLRRAAPAACAMLMLTGFNALDADQPINVLYPFCIVFTLSSLLLFEAGEPDGKGTTARRLLALLLAAAAALGNGAGLAIWPVLVLAAATQGKRRWLWSAVVLVVGGLFSFAYLAGAGELSQIAGGSTADDGAGRRLIYFLDFLSLPWSRVSGLAGAALGVGVIALSAWAVNLARRRGLSASDRTALGLLAFSYGAAVLATAGRGGMDEALITPMRYAVFVVPLQAGLVMLLAPEAERRLGERAPLVAGLVLAALVVQQAGSVLLATRASNRIKAAIAAYETGARTPDLVPLIYPDLSVSDPIEARLKREGRFGKAPAELATSPPAARPSSGGRTP